LQDPPQFTQIWIFGLKTNHLATLLRMKGTNNKNKNCFGTPRRSNKKNQKNSIFDARSKTFALNTVIIAPAVKGHFFLCQ
jgi:hypothetical protein